MKNNEFEFGIYSLGELIPGPSGQTQSAKSRIDDIIAMAKLADEAGLDLFGIGEHHRLDFVTSSYAMILAAIAQATKNIRLTSTLSVISTADPVRVYEDFATLDLISGGRAELIAGRGAFLESFELFGADLRKYDELFENKLELMMQLIKKERVSWQGQFRPALHNAAIAPRPFQPSIPLWIGVGGTPESAARAGRLGVNMALGILGGDPRRVKPLVDIYRAAGKAAGHDPSQLRVSVTGHSYIAETSIQALDEFHPHYNNYFGYFLKERGQRFSVSRSELDVMTAPDNVLAVGSPQQLVEKILYQHELFGHSRFMGQFDMGGQSLSKVAKAIELLATEVAPAVRKALKQK
ncbi:luciferase [Paenibacillus pectinilyticus]|uniref:Luciferase n=1 Tax=Paenibacillus pectinilyticus TaxID=512399 RepID=A0A1C0ZVM9_9BACL|nr:LLM class flavin-dependent oxidoreductase [Paenibacillus pectinilyticus]OCT12166.1 luciferase [Paenibacillus pectinilyticus]